MANPYTGLITPELKLLHKNLIDALLEDTALTRPCRLIYGDTKFTLCTNCVYDPIGNKSSNRYQAGGPINFPNGQTCPMCNGDGRSGDEQTEELYLCVIWDNKHWLQMGAFMNRASQSAHTADAQVMTFSSFETTYDKLRRAKEIIFNTDIELSTRQRYVKLGEPLPCGFGDGDFTVAYWKKAGA